jgi:methylenetetrahydrofolate dehydrogenase (NADP+)/methenyltetrahydrofolate cyclohydrolase
MTARVLDGQALGARMQEEIKPQVAAFTAEHGRPPGLGIVLVGNDPASQVYVRHKVKAGTEAGFRVDLERLPDTATLADTLALVERLNASPVHDGILVQSPLPKAMGAGAQQRVFDTILAEKDVDGFGAESVGLLVQNRPKLVACTPAGVIELLDREGIPIRGCHAVVVGRSDIVGKPMAMLLLHRDATVTIAHSRTPDLAAICRQADILVAAVGKAGLIRREFVKPGAAVIDVGMNNVTDEATAADLYPQGHKRFALFQSKGSLLVGDVHPEVGEVAGALTPVPGGVGPLTITMLMMNTLRAARERVSAQLAPPGLPERLGGVPPGLPERLGGVPQ